MSMTTLKVSVIAALVVAGLAGPTWQQTRLQRVQSANAQLRARTTVLRAQATELAAVRGEVERLRKVETDHAELEQLRQWKTQTQSELIRLREMAGVARRANLEVEQLRAQLAKQVSQGGTNSSSGAWMDALKKAVAQRVEGDLAGLTARLHLTPAQSQTVRDILWRHAQVALADTQHHFAGRPDKDEVDRLRKEAGDQNAQIQALLTPEQQAAWPDYKQDVAAKNARWLASNEMTRLQSELDLTSEQADRAFAALYQFRLDQSTGKLKSGAKDDVEDFTWQLDQQTKALEPILTPTQLESLRQSQAAQAKAAKDLYSKMRGSNGSK
jgi:myosin heavy subunit